MGINNFMKTLYIIGNGFDIAHGLETKYQSFGVFLKENYTQIYDYLIDYYGLPDIEDIEEIYYEWNYFESALADLDYENVLDDNSDYLPNVASDDFSDGDWHALQIEMEGIVDNLTQNLYDAFKVFIKNIDYPDIEDENLLNIKSKAFFINFNYTDTLEYYYNIDGSSILYIHNKADSKETLVLGHSTTPEKFDIEEEQMPEGLTNEEKSEWLDMKSDNYDFAYESGKQEILNYFKKSYKYTDSIIEENENYFNYLNDIQEVFVLGHSISHVDQPYFKKIIDSISNKNVKWTASYYNNPNSVREKLNEIGLRDEQIDLIKLDEIRIKNDINYKLF